MEIFCSKKKKLFLCSALEKLYVFLNKKTGEMAEWSIAAVLKTVELRGSGGSNPSLSALIANKALFSIEIEVLLNN